MRDARRLLLPCPKFNKRGEKEGRSHGLTFTFESQGHFSDFGLFLFFDSFVPPPSLLGGYATAPALGLVPPTTTNITV